MSGFTERLEQASIATESLVCVGLAPDPARMPISDVYEFNRAIVDATAALVCAYKPNLAFYEALGMPGAHDRVEPMEAALAAVASCVSTAITLNSAREGLSFDGLEVTAKATVDHRVLLGIAPVEEAASCLKSVDVDIKVDGDLSDEQRDQILQMARRSPVHAMITGSNSINTKVR